MNNPYWEKVSAIAERQREKGIATYGQGIEMNPADAVTRIEHLQEELVDALMYCEWIKDRIKDAVPVEAYNELREMFMDYVCSGVPNLAPYCNNVCDGCLNANGWCSNGESEACKGFHPKEWRD